MRYQFLGILLYVFLSVAHADNMGYLLRKSGDDAFYVDKKHENGVIAIRRGEWSRAVEELEECFFNYQRSAREGSLYRDSIRSGLSPDSIVMYDPRFNSVRYSLVVAYAHAAAIALDSQQVDEADSLTDLSYFYFSHVRGGDGPEVVEAFAHLGYANMKSGRLALAEKVARRAVRSSDAGLDTYDPVRAGAYLRLGEVYLAAGKSYEAESPFLIAIEVADTCLTTAGGSTTVCRELAVEGRCLLAACVRRLGQSKLADSLSEVALGLLETVKKPLNLPQTDSLLDQFVDSVRLTGNTEDATKLAERLAKERARRVKQYSKKDNG